MARKVETQVNAIVNVAKCSIDNQEIERLVRSFNRLSGLYNRHRVALCSSVTYNGSNHAEHIQNRINNWIYRLNDGLTKYNVEIKDGSLYPHIVTKNTKVLVF